MAYALLSQITTQIKTLFSSTSPPSSSFDQPSHTLKLREDLEALQRMVPRIQAVLADAERREIHDESVKLWLRELRCLAYDADDVLDEYNYQVLRAQVEAGILSDGASRSLPCKRKHHQEVSILTMASSSSSSDGSTWNKQADRMRKIRLRFEEISRDHEALHLREEAVRARQNAAVRPPSSDLPDTPTIFGREKIMEEVISMLLSLPDGGQKHTFSVLPIVGMGGVGKTTLVQHVYNDQRVCGRFQLRGWVCVSDDFSVVSLTKRIIESLTGEACQLNEFNAIQKKLIEELEKGKRLLVVLDDVWTEKKSFWDSLLRPFTLAGVGGSAAIVTTRNESIARKVGTMPFRRLACLSDDTCWLIFEQNAFLGRDPADRMDFVQIGKKIVKRCGGLPLAVTVLGSLLRNEFDRDRWEDILQSEVWDVPDEHDEVIPALRLSYLHLPSYLKPCFLYASVFPKNYKFGKEQLVQLWMAQGFLQCEGRKQVEDIGNMYFDDLMKRSLFSPSDEYFLLHDHVHDLARHISEGEITSCMGKEEVDKDKLFFPLGGRKVRHLSISHQGMKGIEWMPRQSLCSDEPPVIRSLLVVLSQGSPDDDEEHKLPNEMILNLESLRALDLKNYGKLCGLPHSMGDLRHLRYLNLKGNEDIWRLPKTIGMLYNLQVLNLNKCCNLTVLPESIGDLCNLRYLNLNRCSGLESLPEGIGGLRNLRYLNLNYCCSLESLPEGIGGLCNLRYLNLNCCCNLESLPEGIGGLCNLQCLEIEGGYNLSYPRGMSRLSNLRSLLGFYVGEGHEMDLLKDMVHLRGTLEIQGLANVVNPEDTVMSNFRNKEHIRKLSLVWNGRNRNKVDGNTAYHVLENLRPPNGIERLYIGYYKGIRFPSWMGDDASSFSSLTRVEFNNCTCCTLLPPLGQLSSLKHLSIRGASSVKKVGPEFRGVGFPALEVLHFERMPSWVTWDAAAERGDFPCLRELTVQWCPKLESMVPVYLFPALQELNIGDCGSLPGIKLKSSPLLSLSLSSSSSSSSSSIGPPPLVKMTIWDCPLARFSPDDEPLLLPDTLKDFSIDYDCPLLSEWCRRYDIRTSL